MLTDWLHPDQVRTLIPSGEGAGVKVAILDSGVDMAHPNFAGRTLLDDVRLSLESSDLSGSEIQVEENQGIDTFGHGTAVASLVWATAPKAALGSFRVFGPARTSKSDIICRAAWLALEKGYHIINCSFGCTQVFHLPQFKSWVDAAYLRGVHVVAAANRNPRQQSWPASFPSVVATDAASLSKSSSFHYRSDSLVEFSAHGSNVTVPWAGGGTKTVTGTSYAAPHLTGILARLLSAKPNLHPLEAKSLLIHLASRGESL